MNNNLNYMENPITNEMSSKQKIILSVFFVLTTGVLIFMEILGSSDVRSGRSGSDLVVLFMFLPILSLAAITSISIFKGIYKKDVSIIWKVYALALFGSSGALIVSYIQFL